MGARIVRRSIRCRRGRRRYGFVVGVSQENVIRFQVEMNRAQFVRGV